MADNSESEVSLVACPRCEKEFDRFEWQDHLEAVIEIDVDGDLILDVLVSCPGCEKYVFQDRPVLEPVEKWESE